MKYDGARCLARQKKQRRNRKNKETKSKLPEIPSMVERRTLSRARNVKVKNPMRVLEMQNHRALCEPSFGVPCC